MLSQRQVLVVKSIFEVLNFFEGFLQPCSRLSLFGDIHRGPDKLYEITRLV